MLSSKQASVDPEDLRVFARELSLLASKILEHDRDLERALLRLGESFRDQEYEKFRTHFISSRQHLKTFSDDVREFVPHLEEAAEHLAAAQRVQLDI